MEKNIMKRKELLAALSTIADDFDNDKKYEQASVVMKVMQRVAQAVNNPMADLIPKNPTVQTNAPAPTTPAQPAKVNYFAKAGVDPNAYSGTAQENEKLRQAINPSSPTFYDAYIKTFGQWEPTPANRKANLGAPATQAAPAQPSPGQQATTQQQTTQTGSFQQELDQALGQLPKASKINKSIFRLAQNQPTSGNPAVQKIVSVIAQLVAQYQTVGGYKNEFNNWAKDSAKYYEASGAGLAYSKAFEGYVASCTSQLNALNFMSLPSTSRASIINKLFEQPLIDATDANNKSRTMLGNLPDRFWGAFTQNRGDTEENLKNIMASFTKSINTINALTGVKQ